MIAARGTLGRYVPPSYHFRGFGAVAPPVPEPSYEDCHPRDAECVARNAELNAIKGQNAEIWYGIQANLIPADTPYLPYGRGVTAEQLTAFKANAPVVSTPAAVAAVEAAYQRGMQVQPQVWAQTGAITPAQLESAGIPRVSSPAPVVYQASAVPPGAAPSLSFTTSRGGNSLQVGDSWQIQIKGAAANSPVVVTGGKDGKSDTTPMGVTDGSGNWSLSGSAAADSVGTWRESWSAGGSPVGSFSFTVAGPASGSAASSSSAAIVLPDSAAIVLPDAGPSVGGFSLASVPWWGWLLVAGGAFVAFGGSRGR